MAAAIETSSPRISPLIQGTLLAASMLTIMSGATIAPALPRMQERFANEAGSEIGVRLVLTIIGLAIAVFSPLVGYVADRYGRKPLLLFSLVLYAIAGMSGFFAQNIPQLLVGRVFLGLAVAGTMTASAALIADYFAGASRNKFVSLQSAFTGFGGVIFLPLGGILAGIDWHYPFLVYLASLFIVPVALIAIQEPPRVQSQAQNSAIPRSVWPLYLLAFMGMVVFYVGPANGPFRLQRDFGLSPSETGFFVALLMTLISSIAAFQYAKVRTRIGHQAIASLGYTLVGLGWILVGITNSIWVVAIGFVLVGLGGINNPNLSIWLMGLTNPQNRGRVMGGLTGAIFLGQFVSPLLTQPLVQYGLGTVFWAIGLVSLLMGIGLAIGIKR